MSLSEADTRKISYDEVEVSKKHHSTERGTAVEQQSTTARLMHKASEEKVFLTLLLAIVMYIATQIWASRDSAQVQPYIDRLQDQKIEGIQSVVSEIKTDVKTLLRKVHD